MLIDSHVVLWLLDDSDRLGSRAREHVTAAPVVHVSAASVLELTIKRMLGKVDVPTGLTDTLLEDGYDLLPVTAGDAEAIASFPQLARHDPFDRMLLAQATTRQLRFVTADRVLLGMDLPVPAGMLVDARA